MKLSGTYWNRRSRLWLIAVAFAVLAAACGTSSGGGGTPGGSAADADPAGVLRIPFDLAGSGGLRLDPASVPAPFWVHFAIYDTLLHYTNDGKYEPGLAKQATIVDPSTITVELFENQKFQDGSALDSDAVKFSIERWAALSKPGAFRVAEQGQISAIEVNSPAKFTIKLKTPIAGSFYNLLAFGETMPVSSTAVKSGVDLNTNPVGAGPFKLEKPSDLDIQTKLKLVKWDGYVHAKDIRLAGLEFVQVAPNPTAQTNALRTHVVDGDGGSTVTADLLTQLGSSGLKTQLTSHLDSTYFVSLQCGNNAAFKDLRVRQALNYATDKDSLNTVLGGGKGEAMSQFWSSQAKWYDSSLKDAYKFDPAKAKSLLAAAVVPNLTVTMASTPGVAQTTAELLQQQWAQAGIKLTIVQSGNLFQEYYIDKKMDSFPTRQTRIWTDKITRNFAAGSTGNTCDPASADFSDKLAKLRAVDPTSDAAIQVWKDVSKYLSDNAQGVFLLIPPLGYVWDDSRVGDVTWVPDQTGIRHLDWNKVFIKKS
jgi:ABC-type transport system substrate-binding protein